jgi:hypothetical protein
MDDRHNSRRRFLQGSGAAAAALAALGRVPGAKALESASKKPMAKRLLFTITATGGGSVVDSFMAVRQSECKNKSTADNLIVYPDQFVKSFPGTDLRAVDLPPAYRNYLGAFQGCGYQQSTFVQKYAQYIAVMALENTSVNHGVAQKRSMTGDNCNQGRTLSEHMAQKHGNGMVLPNINMAFSGYLEAGTDTQLPHYARGEAVGVPYLFAPGTDGMRGAKGALGGAIGAAPQLGVELDKGRALMARARAIRSNLEDVSLFGQTFQCSALREKLLTLRKSASQVEKENLITQLMMFAEGEFGISLKAFGLEQSEQALAARKIVEPHPTTGAVLHPATQLPNFITDPLVAQTCLAYLLTSNGYSASVTWGPTFSPQPFVLDQEPPLAFDFSHQDHVASQSVMWSRILDATDKLIQLLKVTPTGDGGTMWDRSVIYLATDFGRDKERNTPGQSLLTTDVSTGHHLNNGTVVISPLIKGGVYGSVDPNTLYTSGFNPETGIADAGVTIRSHHVYSAICRALDVPFDGMTNMDGLFNS